MAGHDQRHPKGSERLAIGFAVVIISAFVALMLAVTDMVNLADFIGRGGRSTNGFASGDPGIGAPVMVVALISAIVALGILCNKHVKTIWRCALAVLLIPGFYVLFWMMMNHDQIHA